MQENFTIAPCLYENRGFESFTVELLYDLIKAPTGVIRSRTLSIQSGETDPAQKEMLKRSLPIALANGLFSRRRAECLIEYSRYIIIDLDYKLPEEQSQRDADWERIKSDPYTRLLYHSPSRGIKVLVEHNNPDPSHHEELYETVAAHYGTSAVDPKCKDIPRSNFICYDPDAFINLLSEIFRFTPTREGREVKRPKVKGQIKAATTSCLMRKFHIVAPPTKSLTEREIATTIREVQKWSDKKFPISKGYRNANLLTFACVLHDRGVPEDVALRYLTLKYIAPDFLGSEIEQIVTNAYKY